MVKKDSEKTTVHSGHTNTATVGEHDHQKRINLTQSHRGILAHRQKLLSHCERASSESYLVNGQSVDRCAAEKVSGIRETHTHKRDEI